MISNFPKRPSSRNSDLSRSNSVSRTLGDDEEFELQDLILTEKDREISHWSIKSPMGEQHYGCPHYKTNSKIRAECCGNWYVCRFCHDESEDHTIDRYSIKFMLCFFCHTAQVAGQNCRSCLKEISKYYCDNCHLWDDEAGKEIFHCEKCQLCRRGTREKYIHCDRCSGCITADHFPVHKCLEGSLHSDCPICGEDMFTTVTGVMFMPCGHAIHFRCHQEHTKSSYQCPICLKSLSNMSHFFNRIDEFMTDQQMPEEYSKVKSEIFCNDCEKKGITKFHFVYHRCPTCKSYNTKMLRSFTQDGWY